MKTRLWIYSASLIVLLTALSGYARAQSPSAPPIILKATDPQSFTLNLESIVTDKTGATLSLRVITDNPGWWFIRFESLPSNVELNTGPGSQINAGQWVPLKGTVTLTLLITPAANAPVGLRYLIGRIPDGTTQPDTPEAAQLFAQKQEVKIEDREHYVKFFWRTDRPTLSITPQNITVWADRFFEPKPISIRGDNVGWTFIRVRQIPQNVKLVLSDNVPQDAVTLPPGTELTNEQWCGFRDNVTFNATLKNQPTPDKGELKVYLEVGQSALTSDDRMLAVSAATRNDIRPVGRIAEFLIAWEPVSAEAVMKDFFTTSWGTALMGVAGILIVGLLLRFAWNYYEERKEREEEEAEERPSFIKPDASDAFAPTDKELTERYARQTVKTGPGTRGVTQNDAYEELEKRLNALTEMVGQGQSVLGTQSNSTPLSSDPGMHAQQLREIEQKLNSLDRFVAGTVETKKRVEEIEQSLKNRADASPRGVEEQVGLQLNRLADEVKVALGKQSQKFQGQVEGLEQALSQLLNKLREQQAVSDENRKIIDDLRNQVAQAAPASQHAPALTNERILPSHEPSDRLYARLLGIILGGNVKSMSKEGFDDSVRRAGEVLNQFFQGELPLAQNLDKSADQIKEIVNGLEELAKKGSAIKKEVFNDFRMASERARRVGREIATIQTQLQNKQLQLDFQIQVSANPTGHAIFLEEMGRTVKQAIDKFTDPQSYVESQVDRLIVGDLMILVDLCDRYVAPPGQNEELESALKQVFQAAQLKSILPIQMEPFHADEHQVVEMLAGGRSQAIAHVVKRGFYYKDQIFRKADVAIYK